MVRPRGGTFARDIGKWGNVRGLAASTIGKAQRILSNWEDFLIRREVKRYTPGSRRAYQAESIHDFKAFEKEMIKKGLTPGSISSRLSYIVMYYEYAANEYPDDDFYTNLIPKLKAHKRPKVRGKKSPHQPIPIRDLPRILEAAMSIREVQTNQFYDSNYPDDGAMTALFLYTGLRAGIGYGLRVEDLDFQAGVINTKTKGGHDAVIPLHRKLSKILQEHLEKRDYSSKMLFQKGRYPYQSLEGNGKWAEDARAFLANEQNVANALRLRVAPKVQELFKRDVAPLRAHRIRKSVGTYASQFGLDDAERRALLTHGAKTITQEYDMRAVRQIGELWDQIDLGDPDWIEWALRVNFHVRINPQGYSSNPQPSTGKAPTNGEVLEALERLKERAPEGKEAAWRSLIEGLKGLIQ